MMNRRYQRTQILLMCIFLCTAPAAALSGERSPEHVAPSRQEAQDSSAASAPTMAFDRQYFAGYATDLTGILTSPARWEGPDWLTAAAVVGITVGLYENDAKIQQWVLEHKTASASSVGDDLTDIGHGKFTAVIIGGLYLYGALGPDARATRTALLSLESFVLTGVFTQVLKISTGRHRPNTGDPPDTWDGFSLQHSSAEMSFPSGHASSAFAVASVIAAEYDNWIVPPLVYTIAAATGINRISHNAHWASDVFAGSAIGYFTGKTIVANHRGSAAQRVSIAPISDPSLTGISVVYAF